MSPGLLCLILPLCVAVVAAGNDKVRAPVLEVKSVVGDDCILQCRAHYKPGVEYVAVRWYKVIANQSGMMQVPLQLVVEKTRNILLRNMTCDDSGLYTCHLAAPVGEQNQDGQVLLTLTGCHESHAENMSDTAMAVIATVVLMLSLLVFAMSYVCLRNTLRDRLKMPSKEISLDAPLKPLDKNDLMYIHVLGPKPKVKDMYV